MRTARAKAIQRYIGANVRRLRLRRGMTQERLAAETGVEPRYLQEIERGRTNLSIGVLVALASALDVEEHALLKPAELPRARAGRPKRRRRRQKKS